MEGTIIVDKEGRAWLETLVNGTKRTSYIGFVDITKLEDYAREKQIDMIVHGKPTMRKKLSGRASYHKA